MVTDIQPQVRGALDRNNMIDVQGRHYPPIPQAFLAQMFVAGEGDFSNLLPIVPVTAFARFPPE